VGIGVGFCKYNITIEKCTTEKVEKRLSEAILQFYG
jgi:hypothetical protein